MKKLALGLIAVLMVILAVSTVKEMKASAAAENAVQKEIVSEQELIEAECAAGIHDRCEIETRTVILGNDVITYTWHNGVYIGHTVL